MNKIIDWFTRNSVAANILMVIIVLSGLYTGLSKIILQEFPDYPSRTINVSVSYRGSTPTEVEEGIVALIEEAVYDLEGLKEMESVASSSSGRVPLTIEDTYDLGVALDEIKNRVDGINTFPDEAERPQVSLSDRLERAITIVLAGDLTEMDLKRMGEQIRDDVSGLPGVSIADLKAVRPYEIAIEIPEQTLKQYGLTFDEVVSAIRTHSIDLSAGSIKSEGGNILLRTAQKAYTQDEFSRIVVRTNADGTRISIGDIAEVTDGFDETPIVARYNGERAIAINVYRTGSQNIIELGDTIKNYVKATQELLPEGMSISYWQDDSERISQRLDTLKGSAISGFFLVIITLSLFLRPSLAFWVALGIPIAFSGALWMMPYLGVTLNLVTLFAFILVLGIVVDDAIVTGENIFQHMQSGQSALNASIKGTQEVAVPVIFGVLTTMVAFYPLTVMSGFRGNFFKQIPIVIIPVLLFSLIESKLILPAHLKHCTSLGKGTTKRNWFVNFQRFFADGLETLILKFYRPILNTCLNFRYATAAAFIAILCVFLAMIASGHINYQSFPRIPNDRVNVNLTMPVGTTYETTQSYVDRIEAHALALKKEKNEEFGQTVIANVFATAGGRPFGSGRGGSSGVAEQGEIVLELVPAIETGLKYGSRDVVMELRSRVGPVPEAEQLNYAFSRGSSTAVSIQLEGPRIEDLVALSTELQRKLQTYEGLYDIEDSFERANEEFELKLKPQAVYLGVTTQNLAQQVRQAFFGAEAQRLQRGRDDVRVMVRYPESERRSIASLNTMMIRTREGTEVPFEEVAEIIPGKSLPSIRRIDRNRIIRVNADADVETVDTEAIQSDIVDNFLPGVAAKYPGVKYSLEGRAAEDRDNNSEMRNGVYLVLASVYILLAIPLRSYVQPLIVMSAIPFGIVGALLGHSIMSTFSDAFNRVNPASAVTMLSILGMLALSGVVVNDSLVMVDYINKMKKKGMPLQEAVRVAGVKRFRPILLTSLTTFFGLFPLMLEQSRQALFLIPMAISLAWGVIFATFITLLLVPVINLIFEDIRLLFCRLYNLPEESNHEEEEETRELVEQ
ncbi:efflux RND transporter permease subunit [Puniceicoccaceae bacterium K14]|nr:efflux RND transporter permease subunit [Puniceicoccaceae bacterium K14]